jgi:hypothetical protein
LDLICTEALPPKSEPISISNALTLIRTIVITPAISRTLSTQNLTKANYAKFNLISLAPNKAEVWPEIAFNPFADRVAHLCPVHTPNPRIEKWKRK